MEYMDEEIVYYSELIPASKWGDDLVMLDTDINLLSGTDFDDTGHKLINIDPQQMGFFEDFMRYQIQLVTNKTLLDLSMYHNEINDDEHKQVLNSMPYKSDIMPNFGRYIETVVSDILHEDVKIFNNDIWIRICRPSNEAAVVPDDFNPCHRDVYLDFYRNIVNIYIPIVGSNEKSSLAVNSGSHKWNENITRVTSGGAFFPSTNKKYSVDAIVASKVALDMIRPNPIAPTQMLLFSPYLIHGCASNLNANMTRFSVEIRFIRRDENGAKQEAVFREFLKTRTWR